MMVLVARLVLSVSVEMEKMGLALWNEERGFFFLISVSLDYLRNGSKLTFCPLFYVYHFF
jgi:hypothetical protein